MKIALLGFGDEGKSAYNYYSGLYPNAMFQVYDQETTPKHELPVNVEYTGDVDGFFNIEADIVVRTPAIAPSKISTNGEITSVTKEFFDKCNVPIIGVTGTKGKGTTCCLIEAILKAAGKKVWLVGNIGVAALDVLAQVQAGDIVVYELSSFQLWDLKKSPQVAVILGVEPEHLNVHESFGDYINAKTNIAKYQKEDDTIIYFDKNETSLSIAEKSPGKKIGYHVVEEDDITIDSQKICQKSEVGLLGEHNLENVYAAINATWLFTQDTQAMAEAIKNFKGLPHRLELIKEVDGIAFYDDSFSSAPPSTKVAIKSFTQPIILIAGGYDRGLDYTDLAQAIEAQPNVKNVLLMGETKGKIAEKLHTKPHELFDEFETVVQRARDTAQKGDVVLLSPGCASFDMFKNFIERGDTFRKLVEKL